MKVMSTRSALSAMLGATLILGATVGGGAASHADVGIQDPAFQEIVTSVTSFLGSHDVPEPTKDALIAKLESGLLLDSQNGSSPVLSTTEIVNGYDVTVSRYGDGSVSESRVERPKAAPGPGQIVPFGVSGCGENGGIRTNCYVDRWDGIIAQNFRANFTFLAGYDRIDSVYSQSYTIIGASGGGQTSFGIVQPYENASGPAHAEYIVWGQLPVLGSVNYRLGLRVGASIGGQSYT